MPFFFKKVIKIVTASVAQGSAKTRYDFPYDTGEFNM